MCFGLVFASDSRVGFRFKRGIAFNRKFPLEREFPGDCFQFKRGVAFEQEFALHLCLLSREGLLSIRVWLSIRVLAFDSREEVCFRFESLLSNRVLAFSSTEEFLWSESLRCTCVCFQERDCFRKFASDLCVLLSESLLSR